MFLKRKAQSTAEYAITIGLVVAIAAGVLQVALKGGIRQKNKQALNYLVDAGNDVSEFSSADDADIELYSQEHRTTTIKSDDYADESVLLQGGAEKRYQKQSTESESVTVETIDSVN